MADVIWQNIKWHLLMLLIWMAWTLVTDADRTSIHGGEIQKRQSYAGPVQGVTTSCCVDQIKSCDADDWHTKCLEAIQMKSDDYRTVKVTFYMADLETYLFDSYELMLFDGQRVQYDKTVNVSSQNVTEGFCNGIKMKLTRSAFYGVEPGIYEPRLKPDPSQCEADGLQFTISYGESFTVIANPCDSSPCDINNDCTPDEDDEPICTCKPGYIPIDGHCEENPCTSQPCGPNGTCIITPEEYSVADLYNCSCDEGFVEVEKECLENPCYGNPCGTNGTCNITNIYSLPDKHLVHQCTCAQGYLEEGNTCIVDPCYVNPCGPYGTCNYTNPNITQDDLCTCLPGYQEAIGKDGNTCQKVEGSISAGTIAAAVLGTLVGLIVILLLVYKSAPYYTPTDHHILPSNTSNYSESVIPPKVLILYNACNEFNSKVIRAFAHFLKSHCQCEVLLDMFSTTTITDANAWVTHNIENANKVIFIWSQENPESSQILNNEDNLFSIGYKTMKESCDISDNDRKKWIVARMRYTPMCEVLEARPVCVPLFELHNEMANLYSYLHDNDDIFAELPSQLEEVLNEATDGGYDIAVAINQSQSGMSDQYSDLVARLTQNCQRNRHDGHIMGNGQTGGSELNSQQSNGTIITRNLEGNQEAALLWDLPQSHPRHPDEAQTPPNATEHIPLVILRNTPATVQPSFVRPTANNETQLNHSPHHPDNQSLNPSSQSLISHNIGSPVTIVQIHDNQSGDQNGHPYQHFPASRTQPSSPATLLMNMGGQADSLYESQDSDFL